jgi:lysophospholipase L1-like esterase
MKIMLLVAVLGFCPAAVADPLAIVVGDSIVREYPDDLPIQGWGADLPKYFKPDRPWANYAWGGQSTTSFIAEGRWATALESHPEFVLIQFGINDSQPDPAFHSDPDSTYPANLHQMIADTRAIGAEPILVTPTAIRFVASDGFHVARPNGLEAYVAAMKAQAAADGVGVIDMQEWSLDTYDELGMPQAQALYGFMLYDETPDSPGIPDVIHFSHYGADQAARMIVARLPEVSPNLAASLLPAAPPPPAAPALPRSAAEFLVAALGAASLAGARRASPRG